MDLNEIKEKLRELVPAFTIRVAPLYHQLAWEWVTQLNRPPHIPQPSEIKETLYRLIESLTEEVTENGTGGLDVYYTPPDEHERGDYGLRFAVEERSLII